MTEMPQPTLSIEKIYLRDLSVEVPNAPEAFLEREAPTVEVNMRSTSRALEDDRYEVVLTITITAKVGDRTMFLAEAAQAGVFQIRYVPQEDMGPVLGIACPNTLFPYVRETISSVISRAGFPPVVLAPMNFETVYQQQMQQMQQQPPNTPLN
jgi:preprotein translocase subunit SecB